MVKKNDEASQPEVDEPTTDELLMNLTQDVILDNDPNILASDFIDGFVLKDRPETSQILAMLEMPSESLVVMMQGLLEQSYQTQLQALDNHGLQYFEDLKAAVKAHMLELAD